MELLIDATRTFRVDRVTRSVGNGKRALLELPVETLYLGHHFGQRETGCDVIEWAQRERLLPQEVVLVTGNPRGRADMARLLYGAGYHSADGIRYLRSS